MQIVQPTGPVARYDLHTNLVIDVWAWFERHDSFKYPESVRTFVFTYIYTQTTNDIQHHVFETKKGKSIQNNAFSFMSSSHDNIYTHIRVVQIWGNIYIHLNVWYYWCPKTSTLVSIGSKSTLVSNGWMHSFALISLNNMSLSSVSIGTC